LVKFLKFLKNFQSFCAGVTLARFVHGFFEMLFLFLNFRLNPQSTRMHALIWTLGFVMPQYLPSPYGSAPVMLQ